MKITIIPVALIASLMFIGGIGFADSSATTDVTNIADAIGAVDVGELVDNAAKIGTATGAQLYIAIGGAIAAASPLIQFGLKTVLPMTKLANTIMPLAIGALGGAVAALLAGVSPFGTEGLIIVFMGITGGATGSSLRDIKKRAKNPPESK